MKVLATANYELRSRTGFDLGMLLFLPVHEGFGGRIRYLISGGSALPADVLKAFYGMGFNFFEGYGLTETAPVLTVTSPKEKPIAGSVGQPLPGHRGQDRRARRDDRRRRGDRARPQRDGRLLGGRGARPPQAIRDGWFHTGDLGRFDDDGNLYLVGPIEGRDRRRQRQERLPRRDRGSLPRQPVHQGAVGGRRRPTASASRWPARSSPTSSTTRRCRAPRCTREGRGALPQGLGRPADLEAGAQPALLGGRSAQDREALGQAPRGRGRDRAPAPQERGDQGRAGRGRASGGQVAWLLDTVATVSGRRRADVQLGSRFGELGFDSLMYAELSSALETAGVALPESVDVTTLGDGRRAAGAAGARAGRGGARAGAPSGRGDDDAEIHVPAPVSARGQARPRAGRSALFYERVLRDEGARARATSRSTPTSSSPPTTLAPRHGRRSRSRSATRAAT